MRKLASIERIKAINPIEGADKIELADVLGWHVIIRKEENYKVGDLVIYVEYDSVLPSNNSDFEFLRSCCYSKRYDGFRIKNRKLRGVYSEGIIFPLEILAPLLPIKGKIKEGQAVADILNIRKYDSDEYRSVDKKVMNPISKYLMRYKWFRKLRLVQRPKYSYPEGMGKANEDNIQVKYNNLKDKPIFYYKSEKIEGCAVSYLIQNKKFKVFSHNQGFPKTNNNWWNVAIKYNIEHKMKDFMKLYKLKSLFIQGEIAGPGIQRNVYKFDDLELFIYDVGTLEEGKWGYDNIQLFCNTTNLKSVPILETGVFLLDSSDEIIKDSEGQSIVNKNTLREGIVWRAMDNSTGFKAKSQKYANWFNKSDKTE